jgi:hypothetical protein
MSLGSVSRYARPTDDEIIALAISETDHRSSRRFEPIARGPVFAVAAVVAVVMAAAPFVVARFVKSCLCTRGRGR